MYVPEETSWLRLTDESHYYVKPWNNVIDLSLPSGPCVDSNHRSQAIDRSVHAITLRDWLTLCRILEQLCTWPRSDQNQSRLLSKKVVHVQNFVQSRNQSWSLKFGKFGVTADDIWLRDLSRNPHLTIKLDGPRTLPNRSCEFVKTLGSSIRSWHRGIIDVNQPFENQVRTAENEGKIEWKFGPGCVSRNRV